MPWRTEEFEDVDTLDGVRIIAPNDFQFEFRHPETDSLRVLAALVKRGEFLALPDSQTLFIKENGELRVHSADPWINRGFEFEDFVCEGHELAYVLKSYMESRHERARD